MIIKLNRAIDGVSARPEMTLSALILAVTWCIAGPLTHWNPLWLAIGSAISGIPPFVLSFAIQHGQKESQAADKVRDAAMHLKLDIIIDALEKASNRIIGAEKLDLEKIEELRAEMCDPAAS